MPPSVWLIEHGLYLRAYADAFRALGLEARLLTREEAETAGPPFPDFLVEANLGAPTFKRFEAAGVPVAGLPLDHWYFAPGHRLAKTDRENCARHGLPAWDTPLDWQFSDGRPHPGLRVFTCSPEQVPVYQALGVAHAEFLPFATDLDRFRPMGLTPEDRAAFGCRIGFAGTSLIDNPVDGAARILKGLASMREKADPAEAAYLDGQRGMLEAALAEQEADLFRWVLPEAIRRQERARGVPFLFPDGRTDKETWRLFLGVHVSMRQRVEAVRALAPLGVDVWGAPEWTRLGIPGVRYRGFADWGEGLPKVLNASEISLNLSKPMFPTGVGPRIFEVLACGGFLLSNRNPALAAFFEDGKELVFFETKEELVEKARYYLEHPREREEIGRRGCAKVRSMHGFVHRAARIVEVLAEAGAISL